MVNMTFVMSVFHLMSSTLFRIAFQFPYDAYDERDDELRPPRGRWRCRSVVAC